MQETLLGKQLTQSAAGARAARRPGRDWKAAGANWRAAAPRRGEKIIELGLARDAARQPAPRGGLHRPARGSSAAAAELAEQAGRGRGQARAGSKSGPRSAGVVYGLQVSGPGAVLTPARGDAVAGAAGPAAGGRRLMLPTPAIDQVHVGQDVRMLQVAAFDRRTRPRTVRHGHRVSADAFQRRPAGPFLPRRAAARPGRGWRGCRAGCHCCRGCRSRPSSAPATAPPWTIWSTPSPTTFAAPSARAERQRPTRPPTPAGGVGPPCQSRRHTTSMSVWMSARRVSSKITVRSVPGSVPGAWEVSTTSAPTWVMSESASAASA